jgi:hypothetical protein
MTFAIDRRSTHSTTVNAAAGPERSYVAFIDNNPAVYAPLIVGSAVGWSGGTRMAVESSFHKQAWLKRILDSATEGRPSGRASPQAWS